MVQKNDTYLNNVSVYFYGGVYDNGCIYMADINVNLLLKLNLKNRELEIVAPLMGRGIDCRSILKMNNRIVITYSDKHSEMLLKTGEHEWIKEKIDYCGNFENDQAFKFNKNMYIFDKDFGIRKFDSTFKNINNFMFLNVDKGIQASRISETKIAIITGNSKVMEFDISKEKMVELEFPKKIDNIETICHDGKNYWVTTHDWEIIKFNIHNKEFQVFPMPANLENIETRKDERRFEKSFFYNGKIWVIPYYASDIMLISVQDGSVELVELAETEYKECNERKRRNSMQYISVFCKKGILLLSCATQYIYYLDFNNCKIDRLDLHSVCRKEDIVHIGSIYEGMLGINIKQFLNAITKDV